MPSGLSPRDLAILRDMADRRIPRKSAKDFAIAAWNDGAHSSAIARHMGVSVTYLYKLLSAWRDDGTAIANRPKHFRPAAGWRRRLDAIVEQFEG